MTNPVPDNIEGMVVAMSNGSGETDPTDIAASSEVSANSRPSVHKRKSTITKGVTFRTSEKEKSERKERGSQIMSEESRKRLKEAEEVKNHIILPWTHGYRAWWGTSVFMSLMTVFYDTFVIAFLPAGMSPHNDANSIIGFLLLAFFVVDMMVHFNLAVYDDEDGLVTDRKRIAQRYLGLMFWVDLLGVFPFYLFALLITGEMGQDNTFTRFLSLLNLFRLVRLYRVKQLFDALQFNTHISLTALTLTRNFGFAMVWAHTAACILFFIARQYNFDDENTWIGSQVHDQTVAERYILSLYWSIVTFATVGYGDYSPVNAVEQSFGIIYMMLNMVISAWVIGSMTLLIVKKDEHTSKYRDTLQTLNVYCKLHEFDRPYRKRLQTLAKLHFHNRQIGDEEVLKNLPVSTRRRVLRKLYLPHLLQTRIMKGIRQQFVDAFLSDCTVEIFSAGEEILTRGSGSSDLYLLVEGTVKLLDPFAANEKNIGEDTNASTHDTESEVSRTGSGRSKKLEAGCFINDISFLTETPQTDTVVSVTVIKTLTLSQHAYKMIAEEHPGSVGKILCNLLSKVEEEANEHGKQELSLSKRLEVLRSGSMFDMDTSRAQPEDSEEMDDEVAEMRKAVASIQARAAVVATKDVIKMHIDKLKDDHTTRFLFAASRGCTATITLMCDQGFDPNNADYDRRTALMVASMKGQTEAVKKLLDYHAVLDMVDMHGTSALYEAAKNGHEDTMQLLMERGASLCMSEPTAASVLCQAVFDGDTKTLRRLLIAKINVNAGDYDRRCAVHIAGSEGNLVAMKVLVEYGADLNVRDRWNNTALDEAKRVKADHVAEFLSRVQREGVNVAENLKSVSFQVDNVEDDVHVAENLKSVSFQVDNVQDDGQNDNDES